MTRVHWRRRFTVALGGGACPDAAARDAACRTQRRPIAYGTLSSAAAWLWTDCLVGSSGTVLAVPE